MAPSVPAAKVKRVMFVYLLEVLNGDGPVSSFFAPRHARTPRKRRTRKPREGGAQPISAMAVDTPPPVPPSQPDPPGPLSPGLVPGDGDPSSEEPAGDGFNVTLGEASSSSGVSPTPSDHTVVPVAPSRPGSPRPPSVLGVKCSPPPASPSPPSTPPVTPSSPPPRIGTQANCLPQDWRDWIASSLGPSGFSPRLGPSPSPHLHCPPYHQLGLFRLNPRWQARPRPQLPHFRRLHSLPAQPSLRSRFHSGGLLLRVGPSPWLCHPPSLNVPRSVPRPWPFSIITLL